MEIFPAIFIGGPPHSGKSVLAYNLSQALRQQGRRHYLLRACPDGEGDWANQIDQKKVRTIRIKGEWTPRWVQHISDDIARRHLPLLVDVGGRPTPAQEAILGHCTHAILLAPTAGALSEWRDRCTLHGITVLAEIESSRTDAPEIRASKAIFKARLAGLERGTTQHGPVFSALVQHVLPYFDFDTDELRHLHFELAPTPTVIDLDQLARSMNIPFTGRRAEWPVQHLPDVLNYLPANESLGLYGRGPNWLYAAIALHTHPAPFYQFDPRLGWVEPPALKSRAPHPGQRLAANIGTPDSGGTTLAFSINGGYLDYSETGDQRVPTLPGNYPLIIGGRIPLWLVTALAIFYKDSPLLAVYQPQSGNVVVSSQVGRYKPGDLLPRGVPSG